MILDNPIGYLGFNIKRLVSIKTAEAWLVSLKWQTLGEPVPKVEDAEEPVQKKLVGMVFVQDASVPFYIFM